MNRKYFDLKTLLDVPLWERVQDKLAEAFGAAIVTVDYKGAPITHYSNCTEFCSAVRGNPDSCKRCSKCDALAGLEAVRLEKPYVYLCHYGIVDAAIPVTVGDRYLGAVLFGQVHVPDGEDSVHIKRLISEVSEISDAAGNDLDYLIGKFKLIPEMGYTRIINAVNLICAMVEYIVDRAVKDTYDRQAYEWLLTIGRDNGNASESADSAETGDAEDSTAEDTSEYKAVVKKDSPLYPALLFVRNHPDETVSMKNMAELCHLSQSYFSRLFSREMGETFMSYVNRNKIEHAKVLLRDSALAVSQISSEVGYNDTSYFIQLFKRYEGVTPTVYRQYNFR